MSVAMASTSRSSSSRRLTMISLGARLYLLSLSMLVLLFGGMIITPTVSSPTAVPPADHESILHALRFQGLTASADALDNVLWNHGFLVPASATLFIPMNAAMAPVAASLNVTELVELLSFHIVTENLPVGRLLELSEGTKLQTMVENRSLVVTENTKTVMTINHREVMPKDLCTISTVACYAVEDVLLLESGPGKKKSFRGALVAALGDAPMLPPTGLPLPPMDAPLSAPMVPPMGSPPMDAPLSAPMVPPMGSPPMDAPSGAPMVPPMGSPPMDAPLGAPVPAGVPIELPPPESPVSVPVPANAPTVIVLPPPASPGSDMPPPSGSPGEAPMRAPMSPSEAPEEAPSAAMATTVSMATLVAVVMLTILFV